MIHMKVEMMFNRTGLQKPFEQLYILDTMLYQLKVQEWQMPYD